MSDFGRVRTTLAYARLGLVSLAAAVAPITGAAQELCGPDLFAGEPDADRLMNRTMQFLNVLQANGVVAFQGAEGRMSVDDARRALQDGVGSASLLGCVVNATSIEFAGSAGNQVVACGAGGQTSLLAPGNGVSSAGQLFCTAEVSRISQYLGSEA